MSAMILDRMESLGITLPTPPKAVGAYTPVVMAGDLAFVSGQIPIQNGKIVYSGKVDGSNLAVAQESARLCCMNILTQLNQRPGLERVQRFVRLNGFVNADIEFEDHAKVIDAASDLVYQIFGDRGVHTRTAVGVSSLPMNSMTEIDCIIRV